MGAALVYFLLYVGLTLRESRHFLLHCLKTLPEGRPVIGAILEKLIQARYTGLYLFQLARYRVKLRLKGGRVSGGAFSYAKLQLFELFAQQLIHVFLNEIKFGTCTAALGGT